MSRRSAPCEINSKPWAMAALGSRNWPPSEKLSGVALTMPMTNGRSMINSRLGNCQTKRNMVRNLLRRAAPRFFHQRHDLHGDLLAGALQGRRLRFAQFRQEARGHANRRD